MKRRIACLMLGLGACLVAANSADARHKVRYYYSGPAYYPAPPVYFAPPVYVAPAPVLVQPPVYYPPGYHYGYQQPVVVPTYPGYYVPAYRRPYRELEIKYKWTRRGLRIKYDYDD